MGRTYDQFCALALALDTVGDRWALLIVRDLLLGPRRFGQLLEGLPGIGTDILTARLRDLESAGVVARRQEGRARWYELTEDGQALIPAMRELAVWGVRRLLAPPLADRVPPRAVITALCLGQVGRLRGADGRYEVRVGPEVATVKVTGGRLSAAQGEAQDAAARVTLTPAGALALLAGSSLESLAATGEAEIAGDATKAATVLNALARAGIVDQAVASLSGA